MIKKNDILHVEIEGVTNKGFGIAKVNDFVIFTEGGLTDDRLTIRVIKVKKTYGYGKIIKIQSPSPHRIESPCPVSDKCGGCQWQHCDYQAQLGFKKGIVIDALARLGGITNPPVVDVIGMDPPQPYRNKAVFPIVPIDDDGFTIGMYAPRSHRIIPIEKCEIQHPVHVPILAALREHDVSAYDETTHTGVMRHIIIRTSQATGEVMVVLVVNANGVPNENDLAEALTAAGATTIVINRHKDKSNTIMGSHFRVVTGEGFIKERIGEIWYQLSAPSFFQVNPIQTEILYAKAVEMANLDGSQVVLDAHVGVGGVAFQAAGKAREVIGIDIVAEAIADAEKNAELNGIKNASFICGPAEEVIPELLNQGEVAPDVVFLDPPRKGCDNALLDTIATARIRTIIYISCDPATLARDIKRLAESGYVLSAVQPVDMFPMTGKVETISLLRLRDM
ncbi:MAG: 23S rRNA (uracil(1939)-C(5))-methyltransferase RlmD [Defluviitaleaceae bacterium]|nr:23S rRNA (uracil(1939)-C(5))-methyltransferase RlmD [Defluviitaleaceae bacterium]